MTLSNTHKDGHAPYDTPKPSRPHKPGGIPDGPAFQSNYCLQQRVKAKRTKGQKAVSMKVMFKGRILKRLTPIPGFIFIVHYPSVYHVKNTKPE